MSGDNASAQGAGNQENHLLADNEQLDVNAGNGGQEDVELLGAEMENLRIGEVQQLEAIAQDLEQEEAGQEEIAQGGGGHPDVYVLGTHAALLNAVMASMNDIR